MHSKSNTVHHIHHDSSSLHVSNVFPSLNETVNVYLRVPKDLDPTLVCLRVVHDGEGFITKAHKVESPFPNDPDQWWEAPLTVHNPRTNYRWQVGGGNVGYGWLNQQGWHSHDVNDSADFAITVHRPIPQWARELIVYQIFPDRFASSGRTYDIPDWVVPRTWDQHPEGRGPNTPREYFGGDLWGVAENLDYIQSLGATCIYLTPFFSASSMHRYDSSNFDEVDPLLGGNDALIALVEAAHDRGMKVIGDITLNHSGHTHHWFKEALAGDPEYRDFYIFDDALPYGYATWLGSKSLPKFNYESIALRQQLITGENSVIRRWLRAPFNLDGWRVDVANMSGRYADVDFAHDIAKWTREAILLEGADKLLIGEHNHDAGPDLDGDGWFGNMNYMAFRNPVLMWLVADHMINTDNVNYEQAPQGILPQMNAQGMLDVIRQFSSRMPWRSYLSSWNLLSSHDSPRVRTIVGSRDRQIAAAVLMATFPGTPMIFAGDELGVEGSWGEDSRTTHPWHKRDEWDNDLLATYAKLNNLRSTSPALIDGTFRLLHIDEDVIAFIRETVQERLLVVVARNACGEITFDCHTWQFNNLEKIFGFDATLSGTVVQVDVTSSGGGIWKLT